MHLAVALLKGSGLWTVKFRLVLPVSWSVMTNLVISRSEADSDAARVMGWESAVYARNVKLAIMHVNRIVPVGVWWEKVCGFARSQSCKGTSCNRVMLLKEVEK